MLHAGKAYLCMGQLDEADSQYQKAVALEPSNASLKAEAQLVAGIRSNLQEAQHCLELGDPRSAHCPAASSKPCVPAAQSSSLLTLVEPAWTMEWLQHIMMPFGYAPLQ